MQQPFSGIRVLDMTHVLAGPFSAYQLAVLGADVIKIEPVGTPDCARGRGPDDALNAAGLGLNYLVQGADVLVENYRSGALAALGLGPAELTARNPPANRLLDLGFWRA